VYWKSKNAAACGEGETDIVEEVERRRLYREKVPDVKVLMWVWRALVRSESVDQWICS
jgi:hypothetical protein